MNLSLKYLVPISVFVIGLLAMSLNIYIYKQSEQMQRIKKEAGQASIIANRIANEIEKRNLQYESQSELIRIISQYTLESLNFVKIYDENCKTIFESIPTIFTNAPLENIEESIKYVQKEHQSKVQVATDNNRIDIFVPLSLPNDFEKGYAHNYGALYLQFDLSEINEKAFESIENFALTNALVVFLMVVTLATLMYFLVLKRLSRLQQVAIKMSQGDMSQRLPEGGYDEFTDLNHTFNLMANKIMENKREMQEKIEAAVFKNMEQNRMLSQQNRLAAMGEMINNIAHQWRQPLNALGLILQKMDFYNQQELLTSEQISQNIGRSMLMIEKMSSTIDDFRDFFKKDKEKNVFFIFQLVEEVLLFLEGTLDQAQIEVVLDIDKTTQIEGYKNELMQVLVNIISNAKDALLENNISNKKIVIKCRVINEQMILEIKDNAGGIPEEVLTKIFDPYFTTKEEGKGTGIGLYMSKMIIEENMLGKLHARNEENGAIFSIVLNLNDVHPFCTTEGR